MRIGACEVEWLGSGAPVVFIHGFPLDSRMWMGQAPLANMCRLNFVDLRGHGSSPYLGDSEHSMELLADDIAVVASELGGKAHVVGLSMGGYVALALLETHPEVFLSLALVDTNTNADSEEKKASRMDEIETVIQKGRGKTFEERIGGMVGPQVTPIVRASIRTMMESQPVETIVADQMGMRSRPDRHHLLGGISFPAAVIVGENDALSPVPVAERIVDAIPSGRLYVIPDAGHMSPMENPVAVNRALRELWTT